MHDTFDLRPRSPRENSLFQIHSFSSLSFPPFLTVLAKIGEVDIIDEVIMSWRCNVLHTTFKQPGPADLTLCYLTIYVGQLIRHLKSSPTKGPPPT
jgi:hypothetical protein